MTQPPPDPDPAVTPALDAGGGVQPGDTPPDAAQTSAVSNKDPVPSRSLGALSVTSLVAIAALVVVFAVTAVLLVLYVLGVFAP